MISQLPRLTPQMVTTLRWQLPLPAWILCAILPPATTIGRPLTSLEVKTALIPPPQPDPATAEFKKYVTMMQLTKARHHVDFLNVCDQEGLIPKAYASACQST